MSDLHVAVSGANMVVILVQVCIGAMAQTECIGPMKIAMKIRRDTIGKTCEALMKMFQLNDDALVEQVRITLIKIFIFNKL